MNLFGNLRSELFLIKDWFSAFSWKDSSITLEHRNVSIKMNDRAKKRVGHLARLLGQNKEHLFHILPCKRWILGAALIFEARRKLGDR